MLKADLHIHSGYSSDGEFSVGAIIDMCVERKVSVCTISDHNTVKGVEEGVALAAESNLGFIPAIEIDCVFRGTDMHLLGYGIDWRSDDFASLDRDIERKVLDSFNEMIHNLGKLGISVDADDVLALAGSRLPSAELIAETLLTNPKYDYPQMGRYHPGGDRSDMPYLNFWFDYFAQGSPAYVGIDFMSFSDAVQMVTDNGGVPIVAHPGLNFKGREHIAEDLLSAGARGLEAFNNYHDARQSDYFASLAVKRGAVITCGSDFHGKIKPGISVGQYRHVGDYGNYLNDSVLRLCGR